MSIKVQNLSRSFGNQKAVFDISFSIGPGEIAGFIGPNGAGKSTTMKIISGILPATSGKAYINNIEVGANSLEIKQRTGYLPENNPLYPEMYVREYLEYVLGLYSKKFSSKEIYSTRWREEQVSGVIEKTGLLSESHKKIGELSKGYRQRVGLAQAIIHDPDVLILDEPTTGLDPGQIIEIRNLILELGREKTVLLSTHLMQEVEAICDRVILINKGKIVADGKPGELSVSVPEEKETILLELAENAEVEELEMIAGVIRVAGLANNRYLVESRKDADIRPELFRFAVDRNYTILSLQRKEKTLEELFQDLTKS